MMRFEALAGFLQDYGAILFGLLVGTIAHFGRFLMAGDAPTLRQVAGFLMHLGMIGLVAAVSTRMMGIADNDMRALATAILAISAQEVVQWLKRNGWQHLTQSAAPTTVPTTVEGQRRQAEALSRAATYIETHDLLDDAIERTAASDPAEKEPKA